MICFLSLKRKVGFAKIHHESFSLSLSLSGGEVQDQLQNQKKLRKMDQKIRWREDYQKKTGIFTARYHNSPFCNASHFFLKIDTQKSPFCKEKLCQLFSKTFVGVSIC